MSILHKIHKASDRGRRMALARWAKDRERRRALAAMDALRQIAAGRVLIQRVIVIEGGDVRELCRWSDTSAREWVAMKRAARLTSRPRRDPS